jgi:organic radical activating enzyme
VKIKGLKDEDYVNYKKPSMFIIFPYCSFKCDKENGCQLCQNSSLAHEPDIEISLGTLLDRYQNNPLTKAIVCGGLEPFDSIEDLLNLIQAARDFREIDDDIVIYTGYTEEELAEKHPWIYRVITGYKNIIIKYGRFRPNEESHYDEVLGVKLVSSNQYAKKVN